MRTHFSRLDALDLELHPVSLFEMMDATVEGQQKLKRLFRPRNYHILKCYYYPSPAASSDAI